MGNDGGSLPYRGDLVRTKKSAPAPSRRSHAREAFRFCALSGEPLTAPVVSCALGRLYNKTAVLDYFLRKSTQAEVRADEDLVAGHLRSFRDVIPLNLAPNPASAADHKLAESEARFSDDAEPIFPFVCPISQREMNGAVPFVYRRGCGCVVSVPALKELGRAGDNSVRDKNRSAGMGDEQNSSELPGKAPSKSLGEPSGEQDRPRELLPSSDTCPIAGESHTSSSGPYMTPAESLAPGRPDGRAFVPICPDPAEEEALLREWDARKAWDAHNKCLIKDKKRGHKEHSAKRAKYLECT